MTMKKADLADAFLRVLAVQRLRPGWRFSLIGGDLSHDYHRKKDGGIRKRKPVNYDAPLRMFGWHAEFFGHIDPVKDHGQRHAEAGAPTITEAVQICVEMAMAAIKKGAE